MVREYDPTRITMDERISRKQEQIMTMTPEIEDYVVAPVNGDPNRGLIMDDIEKYNKTGYIAPIAQRTQRRCLLT